MMEEKCTKYEALFTFSDEEAFMEHVSSCKDCKKEYEKMLKVSELLNEVKPYFKEKRKNFVRMKAVCATFFMLVCGLTLGAVNFNTDISDTIKYGYTLSAEDLGFPVDSYGFLTVDE